jgi:ribosomal protein L12E/L44/L45/RPP1/RPP2
LCGDIVYADPGWMMLPALGACAVAAAAAAAAAAATTTSASAAKLATEKGEAEAQKGGGW